MKRPVLKFPFGKDDVNRPLYEDEKKNQLSQKERSPCAPWYQGSVIKMNSTFLECPDVLFDHKGMVSTFMLPALYIIGRILFGDLNNIFTKGVHDPVDIFFIATTFLFFFAFLFLLSVECFRYTHWPMRFNRKTRKVYLYRINGTVMVEDWDKLFFTLSPAVFGDRKVDGLRLAEDRDTVLEGVVLPFYASKNEHFLLSQWEFVRRYMEEPEELPHLAGQVEQVMDIADRREKWNHGFQLQLTNYTGGMLPFLLIMTPFCFLVSIGRWLAFQTCTIPVWPEEVEKECQIEPNDPYLRDRDHLAAPGTVPKPERMR
jgi:hypothetical protein